MANGRRLKRGRRVGVAVGLAAVTSPLAVPAPSEAHPITQDIPSCGSSIGYFFTGPNWTSSRQSDVISGMNSWEGIDSPSGSSYFSLSPWNGTQGGYVDISIGNAPYGAGGYGVCGINAYPANGQIIIDSSNASNSTWLRNYARHEFGHNLGLGHTGDQDNFVGSTQSGVPAMATCGVIRTHSGITTDDRGALSDHPVNNSTSARRVLANNGFEDIMTSWTVGGASAYGDAVRKFEGLRSISYVPHSTSSSGYIYQNMRLAHALGSPGLYTNYSYKNGPNATFGNVQAQVWTRPVSYIVEPNPLSGCAYPIDVFNDGPFQYNGGVDAGNWVMRAVATTNPTTNSAWTTKQTADVALNSYAQTVQFIVHNSLKNSGGTPEALWLDKVEVRL